MVYVAALARIKKFEALFNSILGRLRRMKDSEGIPCYAVFHKVIDSRGWVPQRRSRVYVVAIRLLGRSSVPFSFPNSLRAARRVQLEDIWDEGPALDTYDTYPVPDPNTVFGRNVSIVLKKVKAYGKKTGTDPCSLPVIIDAGGSKPSFAIGYCPCITAARASSRGFYSLQRGRSLTLSELARLQGMPVRNILMNEGMSPTRLGHAGRARASRASG